MPEIDHSPTLRRRRLSAALRALRSGTGLTAEEVSRRLEWSRGKLTHIERAQWRRPSPRDVKDLLDAYGVADGPTREGLIALARQARQHGWWAAYRDVLSGPYTDLENEAASIRTYGALSVPDLLRTEAYATALIRGTGIESQTEIDRRAEVVLHRQRLLRRTAPPAVSALIDEAALRKPVGGPAVLRAQLRRLIDLNRLPNVEIRLVPDAAGAHPGIRGSYVILGFRDAADPPIVHLESAAYDLALEPPADVRAYELVHEGLSAAALDAAASDAWFAEGARRLE